MVLNIAKIRIDGGTQSREALSDGTVAEYAEAMRDGAEFPPVVVYHDGSDYWMADGFHRLLSAKAAGLDEIAAEVLQGTKRDAILHSVGSNFDHGLPRTNADKRRAVTLLLDDPEWSQWSDREIARRCCVHHVFVGKLRRESSLVTVTSEPRAYTTKHGTESTMRTENIGRRNYQPAERRAADIKALVAGGNRADQIAAHLGIGTQQVRDIAKRERIELPDAVIGKTRNINCNRVVETTVHGLAGYAQGIDLIRDLADEIDRSHAAEWARSLTESLRAVHWLQKQLKEKGRE